MKYGNNTNIQNQAIYSALDEAMKQNPEKTREWFDKARQVRNLSDSLYQFAEDLK